MTTLPTTFKVSLTPQQVNILLDALYEKSVETDHYLSSYPDAEPGPMDTCCDAHLARFEEGKRTRKSLCERKTQIRALIDLVEGLKTRSANGSPATDCAGPA